MKKWPSILVLLIGLGLAVGATRLPWADSLNLYVYDYCLKNTAAPEGSDDLAVVGIDDQALERFQDPLVLWHKYLSPVILGLAQGGANAIALDIIPAVSLDRLAPELDRQLIKTIRNNSNWDKNGLKEKIYR